MLNMVIWVISYGNVWVIWSSMLLYTILWLDHSWPLISGAVPCLWRHELGQRDPGGRPRWISPENPGNLGCVKWDTIYIYIYSDWYEYYLILFAIQDIWVPKNLELQRRMPQAPENRAQFRSVLGSDLRALPVDGGRWRSHSSTITI